MHKGSEDRKIKRAADDGCRPNNGAIFHREGVQARHHDVVDRLGQVAAGTAARDFTQKQRIALRPLEHRLGLLSIETLL